MSDLITPALVRLDADLGTDKHDVIRALAGIVADAGRTTDPDQLAADAIAREGTAPTGLAGGIAIPHCRTAAVAEPTLAFVRLQPLVEFGAKDGPADLAFLIAAPAGGDATHLQLLTKLARALVKPDFTAGLRNAGRWPVQRSRARSMGRPPGRGKARRVASVQRQATRHPRRAGRWQLGERGQPHDRDPQADGAQARPAPWDGRSVAPQQTCQGPIV